MLSSFTLPDRSRRLLFNNRLLQKVKNRRLGSQDMVRSDVYQYRKKLRLKKPGMTNAQYRRLVKVRGKRGIFWRSQLVSEVASRDKKIGAMAQNLRQKLSTLPAPPVVRSAGWNAQPITKFREIGLPERLDVMPSRSVPKATTLPTAVKPNGKGLAVLTGLSLLGTVGTAGLYLTRGDKK